MLDVVAIVWVFFSPQTIDLNQKDTPDLMLLRAKMFSSKFEKTVSGFRPNLGKGEVWLPPKAQLASVKDVDRADRIGLTPSDDINNY